MKPIEEKKPNISIEDGQGYMALQESQLELLKRTAVECLAGTDAAHPVDINILLADDEKIKKLNYEFRDIDASTDVLSFPMLDISEGKLAYEECDLDMDTGLLPLGDIVISLETADRQAREYGHPLERELAFLTSHGVFHLLGYDHEDEAEGRRMFEKQEEVLAKMGLQRK